MEPENNNTKQAGSQTAGNHHNNNNKYHHNRHHGHDNRKNNGNVDNKNRIDGQNARNNQPAETQTGEAITLASGMNDTKLNKPMSNNTQQSSNLINRPGNGKNNKNHNKHNRNRGRNRDTEISNISEEHGVGDTGIKTLKNAFAPLSQPNAGTDTPICVASPSEELLPLVQDVDLGSLPVSMQPYQLPAGEEITTVVGVRFNEGGKIYYFDPGSLPLKPGEFVIVDTTRGEEYGEVIFGNKQVLSKHITQPLRAVCRLATPKDRQITEEIKQKNREAFPIAEARIAYHKLDMKLVDVQYAFDGSKALFYFTAPGRVDFRELVKDLASQFHTRIELRQIGIRDEARMIGGLGPCGRKLCCSGFLPDFPQVTIKMVKDQGMSLNSSKISGTCGRLLCCLKYEYETYASILAELPPPGSVVRTADGVGNVLAVLPMANSLRVAVNDPQKPEEGTVKIYPMSEITVVSRAIVTANEADNRSADNGKDR